MIPIYRDALSLYLLLITVSNPFYEEFFGGNLDFIDFFLCSNNKKGPFVT